MEKTGDMDFARANIDNIAKSIRAFNATGTDIGSLLSEFSKLGYTSEETSKLLDELYSQGNKGAFVAKDFASLGASIISAYSVIGTAPEDIKNVGASMQVLRQAVTII